MEVLITVVLRHVTRCE